MRAPRASGFATLRFAGDICALVGVAAASHLGRGVVNTKQSEQRRAVSLYDHWSFAAALATSVLGGYAALVRASLASVLPITKWERTAATPGALALRPVTVVFLVGVLDRSATGARRRCGGPAIRGPDSG